MKFTIDHEIADDYRRRGAAAAAAQRAAYDAIAGHREERDQIALRERRLAEMQQALHPDEMARRAAVEASLQRARDDEARAEADGVYFVGIANRIAEYTKEASR